jgi:hypothetical protein
VIKHNSKSANIAESFALCDSRSIRAFRYAPCHPKLWPLTQKETTLRRLLCVMLVATTVVLTVAASAQAEGGAGIATAPTVAFGQQEFGTLATPNAQCVYASWWLLPVITGDTLQIDWEVHNEGIHLHVWAPGTTEFNYETRESLKLVPNSNLKTESTFQATQTGDMPMRFAIAEERCPSVNVPGPYSFTAYVTHELNVALPHVRSLPHRGTLSIGAHNPEGAPISDQNVRVELQIKGSGAWRTIGTAGVGNGVALVHFAIPGYERHRTVTLRALAHGPEYTPASSLLSKVRTL